MAFIDELRKIDESRKEAVLNEKEEILIALVKEMIANYVKLNGLNGECRNSIRLRRLGIRPEDISILKLTKHMVKEGLIMSFDIINAAGTHDILAKLMFFIEDEFVLRFSVKF